MQVCPSCQAENPAHRFCDQCGFVLDGVSSSAAPPSPIVPPPRGVEVITIGRAHECAFVIESGIYDQVSRRHAEIREHADGRLEIVDLSSANKTFVNGQALQPNTPHPLLLTDHVRLGSYELNMADVRRRLPHDSSRWPAAAPPEAAPPRDAVSAPPPAADGPPLELPVPASPARATEVPPASRREGAGLATHQWAMVVTIIALVVTIIVALVAQ